MRPREPEKPPYKVPTMKQIAALPKNGYTVASTFSGCGGSCLGFEMAGFEVLWANEFVPAAADTYRINHPGVHLDQSDIRTVEPKKILTKIGRRSVDVLEGSPPCASFSTAGKREAGWGKVRKYSDTEQRVDDLFFEFCRVLKGLQPKVFVAENVSGLVKGVAKGYFKEILRALKDCGYAVECQVLDAQWLGVPQMRQRVIFMGVRNDVAAYGIKPVFPRPLPYRYSVKDALPWVTRAWEDTGGDFSYGNFHHGPSPTVRAGGANHFFVESECRIDGQAIGKEWDKLRPGEQSDKYFNLVKVNPNDPCPTVTAAGGQNAGIASITHPVERRKFSIFELKRICSFPDDFVLTGSYAQQWERMGRSVPPLMMRAVARCVQEVLDKAKSCAA